MVLTSLHEKNSSMEMWCICRLTTPDVKTDTDTRESQSPAPMSEGEHSIMADCEQIPLTEDDSILSDGPSTAGEYMYISIAASKQETFSDSPVM